MVTQEFQVIVVSQVSVDTRVYLVTVVTQVFRDILEFLVIVAQVSQAIVVIQA